jgi:hypothetical protein
VYKWILRVRKVAMRKGTGKKVVKVTDLVKGKDPGPDAVVAMSLLIDYPLYERLRKLAFDKHTPARQYVTRGIELVLKAEKY